MPNFTVTASRTQVQSVTFTISAKSKSELVRKLNLIKLSDLDDRFDEGHVDSIDYEIGTVCSSKNKPTTFADEELQGLLS